MDEQLLHVLVVEDNPSDVFLLKKALEEVRSLKIVLTQAKRLDEALACLNDQSFDLVLLDLGLPDSQGLETFNRMQREHSENPILILSGLDNETLSVQAVQDGAQDFLVKGGVDGKTLARTIRYAIERKRSEQRLIASEAGYRRLFETARDGIFILDATSGKITDANPYLEEMLGYTRAEFIGKRLWEIAPFRDKAANQAAFRTLQEKGAIRYDDLPLATKTGRFIDVEFVCNVYEVGSQAVIQCNIRDITQRKQAEEMLRRSEANLATAQQMTRLGSWEWELRPHADWRQNRVHWSDEVFRIFGYAPGEIEASFAVFIQALHPDDRARVEALTDQALLNRSGYSLDHRVLLPSGIERVVHEQADFVFDAAGEPLRVVGTVQDITERRSVEATLLESEARFRTAISEAPVPIMIHREDGQVLQISKGWTKYSGYDLEEISTIGDWVERAHGEDNDGVHEYIKALYGIGKTRGEGEWTITAKDGQKRVWDFITTPLGTFGDNQRVVISTAFDITERKKAKEALEATTREIVATWESMSDAFFSLNDQWRFTHVNSKAALIWERDAEELLGKNIWDELPGIVDTKVDTELHRAMQERVAVDFEAFNPARNAWQEAHVYPSLNGLSVYFRDITERKQAEALLHFRKTLLEAQTEASLDGIFVVGGGEEKKILSYNRRLVEMWGISPEVVASGDDARLREAILSQIAERDEILKRAAYIYSRPLEHSQDEFHLLDGQIFDRYSAPIIDAEGSHFGRVWFFRDISAIREAEAALQGANDELEARVMERTAELGTANESLRVENIQHQMTMAALRDVAEALQRAKREADSANLAKSEFLSRMSHELRTPLNAILGFGQILDKQQVSPLAKESVGYILKGGRHLLDLINEVLDISRVEAGHLELSLEPIALDDIVPEACALVGTLAAERNVRLEANLAELGHYHVLADRQRLKQVLINLLANAIKYNHDGGQVEVFCSQKPDRWMSLAVRDTGPGISPQDLLKLFTPFERLGAANGAVEGTGLGLVLSQRLVTAMGGTLSVQSLLGQGSTFAIDLPRTDPPEDQVANMPRKPLSMGAEQECEGTYSVLCIEDNPSNLRLMETIFEMRPEITLLTAIQGSIGLDMARQHEPDLILLDLNLPDIHGSEVLTRLQQSGLTRDIPVVVVSADATPNQVERLLSAGARDYLTKPVDVAQFLDVVDKFLQPQVASASGNPTQPQNRGDEKSYGEN